MTATQMSAARRMCQAKRSVVMSESNIVASSPLRHRNLEIWKQGVSLFQKVHALAKQFPRFEGASIRDQLIRAALSVPANIAEGSGRATTKDFAHFLTIAQGSLVEVDSHLVAASSIGYCEYPPQLARQIVSLLKMIKAFRENLATPRDWHCERSQSASPPPQAVHPRPQAVPARAPLVPARRHSRRARARKSCPSALLGLTGAGICSIVANNISLSQ